MNYVWHKVRDKIYDTNPFLVFVHSRNKNISNTIPSHLFLYYFFFCWLYLSLLVTILRLLFYSHHTIGSYPIDWLIKSHLLHPTVNFLYYNLSPIRTFIYLFSVDLSHFSLTFQGFPVYEPCKFHVSSITSISLQSFLPPLLSTLVSTS